MDLFIGSIDSSQALLDKSHELRELSRHTQIGKFESVRKLSKWGRKLRDLPYNPQMHCLTVAMANILLKSPGFRAQILDEDLEVVHDVQVRLRCDSQQTGFELEWEVPLWRVLFLLAHGAWSPSTTPRFDRRLAPAKFEHLVSELKTAETPDPSLCAALEELGKFWYALCYNYGVRIDTYCRTFWGTLEQLNETLRRDQGHLLVEYSGALLQLCSLLLLLPENKPLLATFDIVLNLVLILKRGILQWEHEVSQQLYSSLSDYKIPQILQVLYLYLLRSPTEVRERIKPCITGHPQAPVALKAQILELHESCISGSDTRGAIDAVLSTLRLQICPASPKGPLDILEVVGQAPQANRNDSAETFVSCEAKENSKLGQQQTCSSTSVNTACSANSLDQNDSWTKEERQEEAERIMAAIRRLDQLGVITTKVPGS
ncbi:LAME_0H03730g1_1 [Lachancea meyersii CBS 8951]|uniref:LAME_0H03730g1_1 n=1 Tax=Lachancea meyersii CBS 8951 TaxID=1266667 RepID=A0A1G4KDQ8_9SACH|nr:LAME_0H03730g1_1 [Lachancea meyersii CBS 8951]